MQKQTDGNILNDINSNSDSDDFGTIHNEDYNICTQSECNFCNGEIGIMTNIVCTKCDSICTSCYSCSISDDIICINCVDSREYEKNAKRKKIF
jgi:hypothetical protein